MILLKNKCECNTPYRNNDESILVGGCLYFLNGK